MTRSHPLARSPRATAVSRSAPALLLGLGLAFVFACFAAGSASAQPPLFPETAGLELFSDRTSYAPGEEVWIAAMVTVDEGWHVNSHTPSEDYLIPTELELAVPGDVGEISVRYPPHAMQRFPFAEQPIAVYDGAVRILAHFDLPDDLSAFGDTLELSGLLGYQACNDSQCLPPSTATATLSVPLGTPGAARHAELFVDPVPTEVAGAAAEGAEVAAAQAAAGPIGMADRPLWSILLLAFVGGLVLNAMPCVLPVLSIKVFSLVKSAQAGRSQSLAAGLAITAGIVVSFWGLALAAILAARAGAAVGWGVQFQQPAFVAVLAVIVVLFALNLWGLFEIPLPMALAQLGGKGSQSGLAGHFFSGFFATLMATPCSAPFLGTAVGFALGQPPATIFSVFTAIGLGMASPYLLFVAVPGAHRLLPKPGDWMIAFRKVLGFLLAAAAVWLFYVLAAQIAPERLAFVQLALLVLALGVWAAHAAASRPLWSRVGTAVAILGAFSAVSLAANAPPATSASVAASVHHDWVAFDEAEAERLAAEGQLVFVDFTADWCLTCKAIERTVIETEPVAEAFAAQQVVTMRGDWTNRDDTITEYLRRHGRSAVPFFVLYRPGAEPHVFGEVLTRDGLLDVLERSTS